MFTDIPRVEDFYSPTLQVMNTLGGSGQIEEIDNRVIELTALAPAALEARYEKTNALVVPDRTSWARTYLRIAGLLESEGRGLWVLTDKGR